MTDQLTCHDMEMLCRQRAVLESSNSKTWLAEAERWRALAHQESASHFQSKDVEGEKRPWPSPPESN